MLQGLVRNWKTSSLGILTITSAVVHLLYMAHRSEADWNFAIGQILIGVGLLAAGDGAASAQAHADSQAAIKDLQSQVNATSAAIVTGDASMIQKAKAGQEPDKGPESNP